MNMLCDYAADLKNLNKLTVLWFVNILMLSNSVSTSNEIRNDTI